MCMLHDKNRYITIKSTDLIIVTFKLTCAYHIEYKNEKKYISTVNFNITIKFHLIVSIPTNRF